MVSHVGTALLRMLADRAGLTATLSARLARSGWWPVHDRGRVLVDLAVMIADGGEAICDIDALRHQQEVFGQVASDTTVWRALDEIGTAQLRRIATARAAVRARTWRLFGGPPPARAAGRDVGERVVVLDIDSTIVLAHSDKDGAAPTYKHTYGFHPILVTCDNTGEMLAIRLRPGNAGEDRIRTGKDTGFGRFPSRLFAINAAWLELALTGIDLLAWTQLLLLHGDLATAEPKKLRYRLLHTAARLVRGQRRRTLRIPTTWPWATQITAAFNRIAAIPAPG